MASKTTYETVFELGAKIESSMGKSFGKAQKSLNKLEKHTKAASKTTKDFSSTLKIAGAAAVAYKVFDEAKDYLNNSIKAAEEAVDVEKKLETVLVQRTNATQSQIDAILDLTNAQERIGVITGDVQVAGAQQLATFIEQTESIETLTPAMNNLLAQQKGLNASQSDAVNIGNLMGKVMQGQTGALTRVGVTFSKAQEHILKYGTEQERAATLAQVITDNVGEMNKALAQTDSGLKQQSLNIFGQMQEEIGKKLLPLQAKFYSWFAKKIPKIQNFVFKLIDKTKIGFDKVKKVISNVKPHIISLVDHFKKYTPQIESIKEKIIWLKDKAIEAFTNIKNVVIENQDKLISIKEKFSEIAGIIQDKLNSAFESAKPLLEWLANEGLPAVVDFLIQVVDKATVVYEFISANWPLIEPVVYGIIAAFVAYKVIILVITGITYAWAIATGVAAGAMTALGTAIAFVTSPIGIVVLAIGALIAIGVLLYKNWDKIKVFIVKIALKIKEGIVKAFNNVIVFLKEWGPLILAVITGPFGMAIYAIVKNWDTIKIFFSDLLQSIKDIFSGIGAWFGDTFNAAVDGIKSAISGIGDFFGGIFDSVVETVKGNINILIGIFNFMIDKVNSVQVTIPEWVPEVGGETIGFNIPNIPQLAEGGIIKRRPGGILANIGEGRFDEMVMPLNRNRVNGLLGSKSQRASQNTTTIHYKPTIIIQGNADESVVKRALDEAKREFKKEYEAMMLKNKRLQFA